MGDDEFEIDLFDWDEDDDGEPLLPGKMIYTGEGWKRLDNERDPYFGNPDYARF